MSCYLQARWNSERCFFRKMQGLKTLMNCRMSNISEVSTSWSKIVSLFISVISHSMQSPAISLSPYKMLPWGQQYAKVIQSPVSRMLQVHYPRNIYCFAFCCLVTGYLCVLHLWHPDHLCFVCSSQAAGERALPKRTCKTGQWKIRKDKVSPQPDYCGKLSAVVREGLEAGFPKLPSHATLGLKIWDFNPVYERRVPECLGPDRINQCVEAESTCWSMLLLH